jgi:hypothetical protein
MVDIPYLFIFLTPGCDPATHRASMDTPEGAATVVGVGDLAQACEVAAAAAASGEAAFVELCGAFGEDGCREVIAAVKGELPVGYVTYFPEEGAKIDALFAS